MKTSYHLQKKICWISFWEFYPQSVIINWKNWGVCEKMKNILIKIEIDDDQIIFDKIKFVDLVFIL